MVRLGCTCAMPREKTPVRRKRTRGTRKKELKDADISAQVKLDIDNGLSWSIGGDGGGVRW